MKYVATPRTVGLTESYSVDAYSLQDTEIETIDTFSEGICGVIDGLTLCDLDLCFITPLALKSHTLC